MRTKRRKLRMRSGGDEMIIGIKDAAKLIGIFIISCCAVFVCTLFLNFNLDIVSIKAALTAGTMTMFYDAQVSTGKVISAISGGCLLITSIVMLFFYIKHYTDAHGKELGILKALGYSDMKIAKGFWVFGSSIFLGTAVGFSTSFMLMPTFYEVMNEDHILPRISVHFHPILAVCLVVLPTILFSMLSVLYAKHKVKRPALGLMQGTSTLKTKKRRYKVKDRDRSFLWELRHSIVRSRISLAFFIGFASFCYSAMTQMSSSMKDIASEMFAIIVIVIGTILACTTLFLAITTVVSANTKTIAMMRSMGYPLSQCSSAILGGYRPIAYIGVILGTVYQYVLLKTMISAVYRDIQNVPEYHFDYQAMWISVVSFVIIYETIMYSYSIKIVNVPIKEIMTE